MITEESLVDSHEEQINQTNEDIRRFTLKKFISQYKPDSYIDVDGNIVYCKLCNKTFPIWSTA